MSALGTRNSVVGALTGSVLLAISGQAAAVSVTSSNDGEALANNLLGNDVSIVGTPTLQGGDTSVGTFTDGGSAGLGIDEGVALTSGSVDNINDSNTSESITTDFDGAGDPELDSLVSQDVQDATVLSLELTTSTGDVFFNYAFGSDEYNEFVDTDFNDAFGLFLDGKNIAIAPNGDPVSVNNVNCGDSGSGTGPNCSSFNNNEDGSFNFEYDGFTDTLTAEATGLGKGTHSLKLAIADAGDFLYDSGVFIEGGSLGGDPTPVPGPMPLLLLGGGLLGLGALRKKRV